MQTVRQAAQKTEPVRGNIRFPAFCTLAVILVVLRIKTKQGQFRKLLKLFDKFLEHHIFNLTVVPADLIKSAFSHDFRKPLGMFLKCFFIIQNNIMP